MVRKLSTANFASLSDRLNPWVMLPLQPPSAKRSNCKMPLRLSEQNPGFHYAISGDSREDGQTQHYLAFGSNSCVSHLTELPQTTDDATSHTRHLGMVRISRLSIPDLFIRLI